MTTQTKSLQNVTAQELRLKSPIMCDGDEIDRLKAANAELLEALKLALKKLQWANSTGQHVVVLDIELAIMKADGGYHAK